MKKDRFEIAIDRINCLIDHNENFKAMTPDDVNRVIAIAMYELTSFSCDFYDWLMENQDDIHERIYHYHNSMTYHIRTICDIIDDHVDISFECDDCNNEVKFYFSGDVRIALYINALYLFAENRKNHGRANLSIKKWENLIDMTLNYSFLRYCKTCARKETLNNYLFQGCADLGNTDPPIMFK